MDDSLRLLPVVEILDLMLPLPQIVVKRFFSSQKVQVCWAQRRLCMQYIPRSFRFIPLFSELKKIVGVIIEMA
ncbi:hypothetical protein Ccrd_025795 [Cynara cardunculus var. scolymus]|uniref:Uncharacterized protein n=1 Tax=Cynara cardunculus var. scolymus TaxID=59895 RepID=A0A103USK0_CYNCS|nr:hypothetical protein Ccrd_025795 [Cynara cardunculus var. scolymus]